MPYKDPQAKAANGRAYYIANRERIAVRSASYRQENIEQERLRTEHYAKTHPETVRAIKAEWKKRHPDKVAEIEKRQRDNLSDGYVRKKICQVYAVEPKDIPQALVDAHRELLKLKRELRKCKTVTN